MPTMSAYPCYYCDSISQASTYTPTYSTTSSLNSNSNTNSTSKTNNYPYACRSQGFIRDNMEDADCDSRAFINPNPHR